jgi:CheY-like chemotaxis protein
MLRITVRDQGIGIDKADQKRVFEPFFEVAKTNRHSTHSSRFMGAGTGLGLSIVKGIAELHRGRIWVESAGTRPAEFPGSAFHIILPCQALLAPGPKDADPLLNVMKEDTTSADDTLAILDAKPQILLIDSDHESNETARRILESVFEVLIAHTGEEGLAMAFAQAPSLILLETHLPQLDGHRVCKILRSQEETREVPIAFLSSAVGEEEIQRCFASGADDFVVKPLNGGELVDKIWRILMKRKEDARFKSE